MIPRLKPYFNSKEIKAIFRLEQNSVEKFEKEFAKRFKAKYALSFSYGRSAIHSIFKALNIKNSEIITPAYTCVVVPHAIVLSGNIPKFVDIDVKNYNLNLDEFAKKINNKTKVIIPGNIFGYPVNTEKLKEIIGTRDILTIQDCAHCFGAEWNKKLVCNEGDVAIFSLNISKQLSSIFGGMLTTNNEEIYERIKEYRDKNLRKSSSMRALKKMAYLLAVYPAFNETLYNFVCYFDYLEGKKLFKKFTQYYRDDKIDFPKDAFELLTSIEANVGREQLKKYSEIAEKKKNIAKYYDDNLKNIPGLTLPPIIEGATYSHYVPKIENREKIIKKMRMSGIQVGKLIEYSIPHMTAYQKYKDGEFKNSLYCSKKTINLPIYPSLNKKKVNYIVSSLRKLII